MGSDAHTAEKGSSYKHAQLVDEVLMLLGTLPVCRVWKNATGMARASDGSYVRYGLKGSSDILGLTSDGKLLAIEVKSGQAKLSKHQIRFMTMIMKMDGRYLLCKDANEIYREIIGLNLPEVRWV